MSFIGAAGVAIVAGCASAQAPSAQAPAVQPADRPTLVVFITIDQMRADYYDRFGAEFTGGFKRLRDGGAFFPNGVHDHAVTETAPGHAAALSGRFPVHTGIASNSDGVNGVLNAQVLGGRVGESASPERFLGTTLVDWMRADDRRTKWLSVSRKDRGAILTIGRSKGDVYWYLPTGEFTTSQYYASALPAWVQAFNATSPAQAYAGRTWDLLNAPGTYPEPDAVGFEGSSAGWDITFPHRVPTDPSQAAAVLGNYPFMDELTIRFALHGVRSLSLGSVRNRTDILAVSLSSSDAVGHRFGPDSREVHDQFLRLDRYLGLFLDSLESIVGPGRLLVALTSDHGVTPSPMLKSTIYPNGDGKRVSLDLPWQAFQTRLLAMGIDTAAVAIDDGLVAIDFRAFTAARANADSLLAELARDMMRIQGVARVDLMSALAKADTVKDFVARRWLHMYSPQSNVRLIATLTPYSYWQRITLTATHFSPYDDDANVPVLFWGTGVVPGRFTDPVRVVDMAPTLAAILKIKPLEATDGHILKRVVR